MTRKIFLVILAITFIITAVSIAQAIPKEYLPGDFVHIIVESPIDTAQITATLPDGKILSLLHERRSNVWRGIWEVPVGFKRGNYFAKLSAVDISGNVFEGKSDSFTVGEIAMILLVGKATPETTRVPLQQKISLPPPPAGLTEKELMSAIRKLILEKPTGPEPAIQAVEKSMLIQQNIDNGTNSLENKRYSEAAGYFRVALFLDPKNKEAGQKLAQANQRYSREKNLNIFVYASIAVAIILLVTVLLFIYNKFKPQVCPPTVPASVIPVKEREALFFSQLGWKNNPFVLEAPIPFSEEGKLSLSGLHAFIKGRITTVGGKDLSPFTDISLEEIHKLSNGNPKTALLICKWALEETIRKNENKITAEIVKAYESIAPKSILIADDEEMIVHSLSTILKKGGGYLTDTAQDGEEALNKIRSNRYSAVLLDIEMPKLNGYEILKQARAIYPSLPIIFVTGKGDPKKTIESISQYDLTGYIEKPFTPEKVLDAVARALNI
ncbi:MAG: response regulator [Patescibacteria group bacterium]